MEEKEVVPNLKDNVVAYFQDKIGTHELTEQQHLDLIGRIYELIDEKANQNFERITIDKSEVMAIVTEILETMEDDFFRSIKLREINRNFKVDSSITILDGGFATVKEREERGTFFSNVEEKKEILFLSDAYYANNIEKIEAQIAELEKQFSRKDIEAFEEQYYKDVTIKQYELESSRDYENAIRQLNEKTKKYDAVKNKMIADYGRNYQDILSRDISEAEKQKLLKQLLEETKAYNDKSNQAGLELEVEQQAINEQFKNKATNSYVVTEQMKKMHLFDRDRYLQDKKGEMDPELAELYAKRNQMNDCRIQHKKPIYEVKKSAVSHLLNNIAKAFRGEKETLLLEYHPDKEMTVGVNPIMDENMQKVDENLLKVLASLYGKKANDGEKKTIDTKEFEAHLVRYFRVHYQDLMEEGYNHFLNEFAEMPDETSSYKKEGELAQIARQYHIDPKKFCYFGYEFSIREGLLYKSDTVSGLEDVYYATEDGINRKIEDLYGEALFGDHTNADSIDQNSRKLKNEFIEYAKKHGIKIENEYALETMQVNQSKVDAISKYANEVINQELETNHDYTAKIAKDISENYSTIMNLAYYQIGNLDFVKELIGDRYLTDGSIRIYDDHILSNDIVGENGNVIYATPEYCAREYENTMQKIQELQGSINPLEDNTDLEGANKFKSSLRRYIKEQEMDIDTSVSQVPVDTEKIALIADAIAKKYEEKAENSETFREDVARKLQENWSEIMTETHRVDIKDMFAEELKKDVYIDEDLQVTKDCIYLSDVTKSDVQCIYATPEFLQENIGQLDEEIAMKDEVFVYDKKRIRNSLAEYAKENKIQIKTRSASERLRQIEEKRQASRRMMRFELDDMYPDDPTARPKLELDDNTFDTIKKMAEDNPRAKRILFGVMMTPTQNQTEDEQWRNYSLMQGLDDMNIRGTQIWTAYKDYCHEDMGKFKELIHNRDADMVQFINERHARKGAEKAVTSGASFERAKMPSRYRFTQEEVDLYREIVEEKAKKAKKKNDKPKEKRYKVKRKKREDKIKAYRERLIQQGKETIARKEAEEATRE